MKNSNETSLWAILAKTRIEVPIIQRDYAQGRAGKEEIRKRFLNDIKRSLDLYLKQKSGANTENSAIICKLDFAYGVCENCKLHLLDGQQRLTTLWLIHWYIAMRAGKLKQAKNYLKNFTYATRASSREFIDEMCEQRFNLKTNEKIVPFIQNQTWFYSEWNRDPTINAMLTTLSGVENANIYDGIEKVFADIEKEESIEINKNRNHFEKYYDALTASDCPILFHLYQLHGYDSPDDMYIKMNARGKPLTDFENFKAEWIGYVRETDHTSGEESFRFASLLDNDWTDVFWSNRREGCDRIDESFFAFLNRYFLNIALVKKLIVPKTDVIDSTQIEWRLYGEKSNDSKVGFTTFECYKKILKCKFEVDSEHQEKDVTVKDRLVALWEHIKENNNLNNLNYLVRNALPNWYKNDAFNFIPICETEKLLNDQGREVYKVTTLGQKDRVIFYAVCRYFEEGSFEELSLKDWMRVVCNLVENPSLDNLESMAGRLELINSLSRYSHEILDFLRGGASEISSKAATEQLKEEIEKAKKIKENDIWASKIIDAESCLFFKGAIRFLFRNEQGEWSWENFDGKLEKIKAYFDETGIKKEYQVEITKALIVQSDDWDRQLYDKQIFNPNANTWKWILTNQIWRKSIHNILIVDKLADVPKTKSLSSDEANKFILPILEKIPFAEIVESYPECRFRWNGLLALYKPNEKRSEKPITFDWGQRKANCILSSLCEDGSISSDQKIDNSIFFRGWNVDFKYSDQFYQWHNNNFVYLMDGEKSGKRLEKNSYAKDENDRYYCFETNGLDRTSFLSKLKELSGFCQNN